MKLSLFTAFAFLTLVPISHAPLLPSTTHTTSFPNAENPISEGDKWVNGRADGVDWFDVKTTPGKAYGNRSTGNYTDPTAILKGSWDPDQTVSARVFCTKPTSKYYQEVEIRLRSTMTAHSCTGYEIFWRCLTDSNGYTQVVRWNGAVGDFTYIDKRHTGVGYGVADGDTVSASIVGNLISVYRNGALIFTTSDSTYRDGSPGMGFNYGVGTTNTDFGFTSFTATDTGTLGESRFGVRSGIPYEFLTCMNWVQVGVRLNLPQFPG